MFSGNGRKVFAILIVGIHLFLLALYTLPTHWLPDGFHFLGQRYARPLFHQQWRLFAPDPPLCNAEVQVSQDGDAWHALRSEQGHYLERRMVRHLVHHIRAGMQGTGTMRPQLRDALFRMCQPFGDPQHLRYRLMEWCVTDPERPDRRDVRITPFQP